MSAGRAPFGYELDTSYTYTDEDGAYLFEHRRYRSVRPGMRAKTFRYFDQTSGLPHKPDGADRWLYRLPAVLAAIAEGKTIHWTEGEKDADALWAASVPATSIHQGAGKCTPEQAAWLREARRVVIWVDKDEGHWEIGAYDAVRRRDFLVRTGLPAARVRFVKAKGPGKDAADHMLRYRPNQALRADASKLAALAARYQPSMARKLGYRRG
ncbi:hypothetical protein [Curtobacterium sp. MCPF17_051]|uniref:hypothetical protein n=1 Tax=Curtobacterium sp. MCPF17_051 TaxID=2175640 RepID=UPI0015E8D209|nr:hypothetical protein [Curtobacterium sp. MCPF17_051]